jgi:hypothetical protein
MKQQHTHGGPIRIKQFHMLDYTGNGDWFPQLPPFSTDIGVEERTRKLISWATLAEVKAGTFGKGLDQDVW